MEGVTGYLTKEGVAATFDFIKKNSASGSVLLFDFVRASAVRDPASHHGALETQRMIARLGEPRGGFSLETDRKATQGSKKQDEKEKGEEGKAGERGCCPAVSILFGSSYAYARAFCPS